MIRRLTLFIAGALIAAAPALADPDTAATTTTTPVILLPLVGAANAAATAPLPPADMPAVKPAETAPMPAGAGARCAKRKNVTS